MQMDMDGMSDSLTLHTIYGGVNALLFIAYLFVRKWEPQTKSLVVGLCCLAATIAVVWWYADALMKPVIDFHYPAYYYYYYARNGIELLSFTAIGLMFISVMYADSIVRIRHFLSQSQLQSIRSLSSSSPEL